MARILYFYQYFGTSRTSWSNRAYEFARRWVDQGHSVTVITSVYDKSDLRPQRFFEKMKVDGIDVRLLNIRLSNKHGFVRRVVSFFCYAAISCWYALFYRYDVALCSSGPITVGLPGVVSKLFRRKRFVFEVRDLWPEGAIQLNILKNPIAIYLARLFERMCYRLADRVVTLSKGQADWISKHVPHTIGVVENAADNDMMTQAATQPISPISTMEGTHWAIYAGSLGLIDDCGQILDMAAVLLNRKRHDISVVMIGDGKERQQLEQRKEREGLTNVFFLGLHPKTVVMAWLAKSTCTLFTIKDVPFLNTASPNKIFDAFAAGIPTVQVSSGWIRDLFKETKCGLNVPINHPELFADAVEQIVDHPDLATEMGRAAKHLATTQFDREYLAQKMLSLVLPD